MALKVNNYDVDKIYWRGYEVSSIYTNGYLLWSQSQSQDQSQDSVIKSCFASGYWIDDYPWTDDLAWVD